MTSDETRAELRERVAKALCTADEQNGGLPWEALGKHARAGYYDNADTAIDVVLEEAARRVEDVQDDWRFDVNNLERGYASEGVPSPAAAIRALKSSPGPVS
jgi:hypothetical protein